MDPDTEMHDATSEVNDIQQTHHYVVAVDFGTTFSSVAYVSYTHYHQRRHLTIGQIEMIDGFPYWPHRNTPVQDVPTELWYPGPGQQPDGTNGYPSQQQELLTRTRPNNEDYDSESDSDSNSDSEHTPHPSQPPSAPVSSATTPWLYWGYGVPHQVVKAGGHFDHSRRLARFKLMLDDTDCTQRVRGPLEETCKRLNMTGLIETNTDLIAHYLEHLFRHTRDKLTRDGYTPESSVEFVLCVPAAWEGKACRRMHAAMGKAIEKSGFGNLHNGSIDNLFIVSEPEAAAAAVVESGKAQLMVNETFILIDAGGGTVDAITYTVDKDTPLRLKTEEVELGAALCGSSYINERFEDLLIDRLRHEDYLAKDGEDLSRVIDRLVVEFERIDKGVLDTMFPNNLRKHYLNVEGLKSNKSKHFHMDKMRLSKDEIRALFYPSLEPIANLMRDQIQKAQKKPGVKVTKVILMGGFGQSTSLYSYLERVLKNDDAYQGITLVCPMLMSMAVAQGAILRAARKEDGPARFLRSSYGFLRDELYKGRAEFHVPHDAQDPVRDKADGHLYVDHTIEWMVQAGTTIPAKAAFTREVEYIFALNRKELKVWETLFVADMKRKPISQSGEGDLQPHDNIQRESHYRYDHPKNSDAELLDQIEFDVTHLKNTEWVQKTSSNIPNRFPYYTVCGTLVLIVNGRNLRYELHLGHKSKNQHGGPIAVGQTCLAAAFEPGTE